MHFFVFKGVEVLDLRPSDRGKHAKGDRHMNTQIAANAAVNRKRRTVWVCAAACFAAFIFAAGYIGGTIGKGGKSALGVRSYTDYNNAEPAATEDGGAANALEGWYSGRAVVSYDQEQKAADGETIYTIGNYAPSNAKLIYTANMSLQSTEFEKTCAYIKALAASSFGYIESETVNNGSRTGQTDRSASYVVRVPAENYNSFLESMGKDCHVVSLDQKMTDVGEEYFDTEQRLETLRIKHGRLEELLAKATDMSDIIMLENELSDNEYQINSYQGTLNKYDSLINYSTVRISLREVEKAGSSITDRPGFFERLGTSFSDGFSNTLDGLEAIAYWLSYHLIGALVFAAIVFALIRIKPIKRIKAGRTKKEAAQAAGSGSC